MTISLKHVFESPVADNGDADLVGPDEWNAEHALTQATSTILGRVTAGTGATEELTATQVRTLINVEDGSTGDMSAAEILAALITVDGTGSGLDADLLDGQSGAYYLAWGNFTGTPTTLAGYGITDAQPLDSDLTAIAALTTTTYGRSLLELADESALEASIDTLANLTSVQGLAVAYADAGADALWGWDDSGSTYTNLSAADALVALGVTASAAELNALDGITATVTELNYTDGVTSAIQTQLDGKQPLDASLTAYAALTTAADKGIYFSAADTPVTYDLTAYGRTLAGLADETALEALLDTLPNLTSIQSLTITLADAGADAVFGWDDSAGVYQNLTAADARTALGLVIGTNVQAYDADLTTLSTAFTTASASGAASLDFHEDTDNGTNRVRLQGPASTADVTLTLPAATDTLVGKATTDTLTNKTFDANGTGNSLSNVEVADFAAAAIVTEADTISANDNDTTIPTSAAVKAYADSVVGSGVTDGDKGDVVVSGGGATWLVPFLSPENRLINGNGAIYRRPIAVTADDTYCFDRHYALTQTSTITPSQISDVADGLPHMMRLTQSQASAQRMGLAQIIESVNCKDLRGQEVTLLGKLRCSASQAIRYAVLEWTGTADSVTSDVVNDWTSATFTAGNFFNSTTLTVTAVGTTTPSANTVTDFLLTTTLGSSGNNVIVMIWTEGTAAQNVTLDVAWEFVRGDQTGKTYPVSTFRDRGDEIARCKRYLPAFSYTGFPTWLATGMCYSTTQAQILFLHDHQPRTAPTGITVSDVTHFSVMNSGAGGVTTTGFVFSQGSIYGSTCVATVASGLVAGDQTQLTFASGATSASLLFTGCEL